MPVFSKLLQEPNAHPKHYDLTNDEIVRKHGQIIVDLSKNHYNREWVLNNIHDYCRENEVEIYTDQIHDYVNNWINNNL
jgi:hypothetical protein